MFSNKKYRKMFLSNEILQARIENHAETLFLVFSAKLIVSNSISTQMDDFLGTSGYCVSENWVQNRLSMRRAISSGKNLIAMETTAATLVLQRNSAPVHLSGLYQSKETGDGYVKYFLVNFGFLAKRITPDDRKG